MTEKKLSSRSLSREKRWEQPKLFLNFYRANEVWSKVIFSQACVKNSVHSGGVPGPGGAWSGGTPAPGGSAPGVSGLGGCLVEIPTGYCCGRYASYWNAFLFLNIFDRMAHGCEGAPHPAGRGPDDQGGE